MGLFPDGQKGPKSSPYLKSETNIPQWSNLLHLTTVITTYYIFLLFWFLLNLYRFFNDTNDINFHGVRKTSSSRPPEIKSILKWRLWRHNFCAWCNQQNFMTWRKSYFQFGCNQRCVTLVFLYEKWSFIQFYKDLTSKTDSFHGRS